MDLSGAFALGLDAENYAKVRTAYERAAVTAEEVGDATGLAANRINAALVDAMLGDFAGACRRTQTVLAFGDKLEPYVRASALVNLALFLVCAGDAQGGRMRAFEALTFAREHNLGTQEASALHHLGVAEAALGDVKAAIDHGEQALALIAARNTLGPPAPLLADLALWYVRVDDLGSAQERVARLLEDEAAMDRGLPPRPAYCWWAAAQVLRACGEREMSGRALARSAEIVTRTADALEDVDRRRYLAVPWHRQMYEAVKRSNWPSLEMRRKS